MKHVVVILDGLADVPAKDRAVDSGSDALDGHTPLEMAVTPNLDELALDGRLAQINPSPKRPGAALATLLAALGAEGVPLELDPRSSKRLVAVVDPNASQSNSGLPTHLFTAARSAQGFFAAVGQGLPVGSASNAMNGGRVALALSFLSQADGRVTDAWLDDLSKPESASLLETLRGLPAWRGWDIFEGSNGLHIALAPPGVSAPKSVLPTPRAMPGEPWERAILPGPVGAAVKAGFEALSAAEVNRVRLDLGMNPANLPWLWGAGSLSGTGAFASAARTPETKAGSAAVHAGSALGLKLALVSASPISRGVATWLGITVVSAEATEPPPMPEPDGNPWPRPGDASIRRSAVSSGSPSGAASTWSGQEVGPLAAAKRHSESSRFHADHFRSLSNSTRVALETADLVVVHSSVIDSVSARRRRIAKRHVIESLDEHLIGPLVKHLRERYGDGAGIIGASARPGFRIAVVAGSVNDSSKGRHAESPLPLVLWGSDVDSRTSLLLTEANAARAGFGLSDAAGLLAWVTRGL